MAKYSELSKDDKFDLAKRFSDGTPFTINDCENAFELHNPKISQDATRSYIRIGSIISILEFLLEEAKKYN